MARVTFIDHHDVARTVKADVGQSLMEVAKRHHISEIVGECGGSCACATCHVHVADAWRAVTGPPTASESDLLDLVPERRADSRLSCQIRIRAELDGLVVKTPQRQI